MTKLTETLKNNGWVETTLGECQVGEEVLLGPAGPFPRAMRVARPAEWGGEKGPFVNTNDGGIRRGTLPVLRPPRPEYAPGTVALIRGRGDKSLVRAWKVPGQWILTGGIPLDDDVVEVVRVLLPADQDTPAVEVTEEMVGAAFVSLTGDGTVRWAEVREALKAALGVEK